MELQEQDLLITKYTYKSPQ